MKSNRNLGQRGQPAIYFRRIAIFASEDVGLADLKALPLAIANQQAIEFVGLPGGRIPRAPRPAIPGAHSCCPILAHATAYMCRAKESREAYETLDAAIRDIESEQTE